MQRVTVTLDDDLLASLDARAAARGYGSRSEALRDLVRDALGREATAAAGSPGFATLSYVYEHEVRDLARRLTHRQHEHHDLTVASMHVHLDHETCLEVAILKGASDELRALADAMTSQRGVRFGHLHLIPAPERGPEAVPDRDGHAPSDCL